ncbi:unnamed protein product [Spirodela intermedia]|uniref:Uncharacterized protein n=1 Tax=Spirodela intermedia TaxID=51605 RepID=A0A7I8JQU6_SPIIN|nr:unnamed protein product [Spirodela intermedia]CAA6672524.1 unnamed protein product [Spirodela intermedia]
MASGGEARALSPTEEKSMMDLHEQWMVQHGRTYRDESERRRRLTIFESNVKYVESFNREGGRKYELEVNAFADLTEEEFQAGYLGFRPATRSTTTTTSGNRWPFTYGNLSYESLPSAVDWREAGAVTAVKNQGHCGACWAFSATAAVEGAWKIARGELVSLSEQELIDCDTGNGNEGCVGGYPTHAFEFIADHGGIAGEAAYPYSGNPTAPRPAATITSYAAVPSEDERSLLKAVSRQPVSVAIDSHTLRFYAGGVFTGPCGTNLNHAVTIVGYGTTPDGTNYWLAKNSWGSAWGEAGYVRLQRDVPDKKGLCGLTVDASYPIP